jgi:hypothetical protein
VRRSQLLARNGRRVERSVAGDAIRRTQRTAHAVVCTELMRDRSRTIYLLIFHYARDRRSNKPIEVRIRKISGA